jgi:hypothetical protein
MSEVLCDPAQGAATFVFSTRFPPDPILGEGLPELPDFMNLGLRCPARIREVPGLESMDQMSHFVAYYPPSPLLPHHPSHGRTRHDPDCK